MPSLVLAIYCVNAPLAHLGPLELSLVIIQRRERFLTTVMNQGLLSRYGAIDLSDFVTRTYVCSPR